MEEWEKGEVRFFHLSLYLNLSLSIPPPPPLFSPSSPVFPFWLHLAVCWFCRITVSMELILCVYVACVRLCTFRNTLFTGIGETLASRSSVPQKGTMAMKVNYNSGIYITCNELPQISGTNSEAIYDRLQVFEAQPIRKVKASCKRKFGGKCMKGISVCY